MSHRPWDHRSIGKAGKMERKIGACSPMAFHSASTPGGSPTANLRLDPLSNGQHVSALGHVQGRARLLGPMVQQLPQFSKAGEAAMSHAGPRDHLPMCQEEQHL